MRDKYAGPIAAPKGSNRATTGATFPAFPYTSSFTLPYLPLAEGEVSIFTLPPQFIAHAPSERGHELGHGKGEPRIELDRETRVRSGRATLVAVLGVP